MIAPSRSTPTSARCARAASERRRARGSRRRESGLSAWGGGMIGGGGAMGGAVGGSRQPRNGLPFAGIPPELRPGRREAPRHASPSMARRRDGARSTHRMKADRRHPAAHAAAPHAALMPVACVLVVIEAVARPGRAAPHARSASTTASHRRRLDRARRHRGSSPSSRCVVVRGGERLRGSRSPDGSRRGVMYELRVRVVRAPPAAVARLLHRREGGRDHDPHDERHRGAPAAAPGRPRAVRASRGSRWSSSPSILFTSATSQLALITLLVIVPGAHGRCRCGSGRRSDTGYNRGPRRHRRRAADLSESLSGVRVVTGSNRRAPQRAAPPQRRRRRTATPTTTPRTIDADLRRRHRVHRLLGQAALLLIGGNDGARRHALRSASSPRSSSTSTRSSRPIQQLVQQYNLYQQGQAAIVKLRDAARDAPDRAEERRTRCRAADRGRDHARGRVVRLRPRQARCCTTSTSTSPPGETIVVRRSDRRRQVDDRQAGHPLLRPDRGPGADRRPRPARRHDRVAAPPARRGAAGAVPLRRHHPRQHRLRPPGRHRRRGHGGGRARRARPT